MARDGKLVIRPDSGDPADIICGTGSIDRLNSVEDIEDNYSDEASEYFHENIGADSYVDEVTYHCAIGDKVYEVMCNAEIISERGGYSDNDYYTLGEVTITHKEAVGFDMSPVKGSIECLWEIFGGTVNEKGYKELDPHIGLIYGDSITLDRCRDICKRLEAKGFASTNVVFGVGSFSYQYTTRDTYGFAIKATYAEIDGKPVEIFKKPKTDDGMKNSAKGLTAVFQCSDGEFYLQDQTGWDAVENCAFNTVFEDGIECNTQSLAEIRATIERGHSEDT
jgi:nicotinic acid phosphoribosyltransferase